MPTYEYVCDRGYVQSRTSSFVDRPNTLPCPCCGKAAEPRITGGFAVIAKDQDYAYNKARNIPNMGRRVRSDQQQDALYRDMVQTAKNNAARHRRDNSRKADAQFQHIAKVPLEVHESVVENERDKEVWAKAVAAGDMSLFKKTGTYLGE